MSVERTDYIIYGWKLEYNKDFEWFDDIYLPYIEGHEGIEYSIIIDGMNGEYIVFGYLIALSDSINGWDFKKLNNLSIKPSEVIEKYIDVFRVCPPPAIPELFIFSHYS